MAGPVGAAIILWDGEGGDNLWTNPANWYDVTNSTNDVLPTTYVPGDDLQFNTSAGTIWLNGGQTANSLSFSANAALGAYGTSNVLTVSSASVSVGSGTLATMNAAYNSFALNISGGGTLFMNHPGPAFTGGIVVDGAGTTLLHRQEGLTPQYNGMNSSQEFSRFDQVSLGVSTAVKTITLQNGGVYRIIGTGNNSENNYKNIVIGSGGGTLNLAAGYLVQNLDDVGQITATTEAFTKAGKGRLLITGGMADGNPLGGVVNVDGGILEFNRLQGGSTTAGTRFAGIAATGTVVNINSGGTLLINNGTQGRIDVPTINLNDGGILATQGNSAHIIGLDGGGTTLNVSGTARFLLRDLFNPQQARLPRVRTALTGNGTLELIGSTENASNTRLVLERGSDSTFSGLFRLYENTVIEANPRFNPTVDTGKVLASGDIEFAGWGNILDVRDSNSAAASVFDYNANDLLLTSAQVGSIARLVVQRATTATGTGHLFHFGTLTMGNQRLTIEGNNSYQAGLSGTATIAGNAIIEMRSDGIPLVLTNAVAVTEDAAGRKLTIFKTGQGNTTARDVISGGVIGISNLEVTTGTLHLRGELGAIGAGFGGAAPTITINGGGNTALTNTLPTQGLLHLDSNTGHVVGSTTVFAAANNNDRVIDSAIVNLLGNSTLRLTSANNVGTTETIGTVNVGGHGTFDIVKTGTAASPVALTLTTLNLGTRATANFTGTSLGVSGNNTSRIILPGTATGILSSYYHSGNEWAKYDSALDSGFELGVTPFVNADYALNTSESTWASGQKVKYTAGGTFLTGNRSVDRFNMAVAGSINLNGYNLTLVEGGVITSVANIGFVDNNPSFPGVGGVLTAGVGPGPAELVFYANAFTDIKVPIADNADGGSVSFVKSGPGELRLTHQSLGVGAGTSAIDPYTTPTWTSTLTGSWIINDGRLNVHRGQFLGGRPVILNGGHLEINQPVSNANADSIITGWGNDITINANASVAADDNGESADANTGDRALVKLGSLTINNGAIMGHGSFSEIDIAYMGGANFYGTPTLTAVRSGNVNSCTIINGVLAGSGFNMTATLGNASVVLGGGSPDSSANTYDGTITVFTGDLRMNKANGTVAITDGTAVEDVVINGGALYWGPGHHGDLITTNNINLTNNGLQGIAPTSPAAVLAAGQEQIADTATITLLYGTLGQADRINNETFGTLIQKNGTFNVGLGSITVGTYALSGGAFTIDRSGSFTAGTINMTSGAPDLNVTTGIAAGPQTTLQVGAGGISISNQNINLGTGSSANVMGSGGVLKLGGNLTFTGSDLVAGSYGRKGIFVQIGNSFRQLGNSRVDLMGGTRDFNIATDAIYTITAPITNGGLTKSGGGALVLEPYQASNFAGAITVNAGVLQAKGDGAFGTSAGGVTINNGGTVKLDSGWTYGDDFVVTGPGALVPGGLGVREVGALVALGGFSRLTGAVSLAGDATLAGDTFLDPSVAPGAGGLAYRIGTLRIESAGGITGAGHLTLSGHGDGVVAGGVNTTSGGLTKDGAGRWTLAGASSYVGATAVAAGSLRVTHAAALGSTSAGTTVYSGATLELLGGISLAEPLTLAGSGINSQSGAVVNLGGANTLAGTITMLGAALRSDAGSLTVAGAINGGANELTLAGAAGGSVSGNITAGALTKRGAGVWTLAGANALSGGTDIYGGTLLLNYAANNGNKLNSTGTLTMHGGSLSIVGSSSAATVQSVGSLTLAEGGSAIQVASGVGQSATLNLGNISRGSTSGATVDFVLPSSGAITTTSTVSNGILGGWATVGGQNWASLSGSNIVALASYTPLATATSTDNAVVSTPFALAASSTVHSLKIAASNANLNLGANNLQLGSGGLLYTGTGNAAITGAGYISGLSLFDEFIVHTASGTLDIAAPIIGSFGWGGLTKTGAGTLVLSAANDFSGTINVNGGTLAVVGSGGTGATVGLGAANRDLILNGGTFAVIGPDYDPGANTLQFVIGPAGGTIRSILGAQITINDGNTSGLTPTQLRGSGDLTFAGGGRYRMEGGTPQFIGFTGKVTVDGGLLLVGHSNALGGRKEQTITLKSGSAIVNQTGFGLGLNGLPNDIIAEGGVEFFAVGGNRVYGGDIQLYGTNTITLFERDTLQTERQLYFNGRVSGSGVTLNVFGANNGSPFYLTSGANNLTGTINLNPNAVLEVRSPGSLGMADGDVTVNLSTNSRLLLRHWQNADYHADVVVNGHAEINSDRLTNFAGGAQQFLSIRNLTVNGDNTILTVGGANNYYTRVGGTATLNGVTSTVLNVTASDLILENGLNVSNSLSTIDKRGAFSVILRGPVSNHTGTLLLQQSLFVLQDGGALPNTSTIELRGGELRIDNSNGSVADRVNDWAAINLGGGVLRITGPETLGTVTALAGVTQVISNPISETTPVPLVLTGFTRNTGAIVQFQAPDLGTAVVGAGTFGQSRISSRILLPTTPALADTGRTIPGFVGNNAIDFVQYSTTLDGGVPLGFQDMRNPGTGAAFVTNYTNDPAETAWNNTVIARLTNGTDSTTVTTTLTANRALDAIKVETGGTNRIRTIDVAAYTLRIEGGGILDVSATGHVLNINGTGGLTAGTATPGSSTAELVLGGTGTITVAAPVKDNSTQPVAVVKVGSGTVNFNGNNTNTGGLYINAGTLNTTSANFNGSTPNPIYLAGGTLTFNIASGSTAIDLGVPDHPVYVNASSLIVLDNGTGAGTDNDISLGSLTINGPYTLGLRSFDSMDASFTGFHSFFGTPTLDMAQAASGGNQTGVFTISGTIAGSGFNVGSSGATDNTTSVLQIGGGATDTASNTYNGKVTVLLGVGSTGSFSEDLRVELNKADGYNAITGDLEINGGVVRNMANDQIADSSNIVINQGQYHLNSFSETVASITMTGGNVLTAPTTGSAAAGTLTITGALAVLGLDDLTGGITTGFTVGNKSTVTVNGLTTIGNYGRIHLTEGQTFATLNINGGLQMIGGLLSQSSGSGANIVRLSSDVTTLAASVPSNLGSSTDSDTFLELNGVRTFTVADGPAGIDLIVSTVIRNSTTPSAVGGFIKAGPGVMQLQGHATAANSYTGTTTVNEGTLVLARNAGTNAIPGGALTIGDGVGGPKADIVILRNSNQIADGNNVTIASSGLLDLETFNTSDTIGGLNGDGAVDLGPGSVLTINSAVASNFAGVLAGAGSLAKTGADVFKLSGTAAHSGVTTVTAGALVVNGAVTRTSVVNVDTGATLGGLGSIAGAVSINAGGTLDPGDGTTTGALTINNSLTFDSTAAAVFGIASDTNYDSVVGVSSLTYGGTLTVQAIGAPAWAIGQVYDLFGFASQSGTFNTITLPTLPGGLGWRDYGSGNYFDYATGQIEIVSAGPAVRVWNGGSPANDFWTSGSNWVGGNAPVAGDQVVFAGNVRLTPDNDNIGLVVGGLKFSGASDPEGNAGAFTLGGNALTVAGKIENNSTNAQTINHGITLATAVNPADTGVVNVAAGAGTLTIAGNVGGTVGLVKTGTGTAALTAASNSYTGDTYVKAGTLQVDGGVNSNGTWADDTTVGLNAGDGGPSPSLVTLVTEHVRQDTLKINDNGKVVITGTSGPSSTSVVNLLLIGDGSGGFTWSFGGLGGGGAAVPVGGEVGGSASPVPEPSTWALAAMALLAFGYAARRRK